MWTFWRRSLAFHCFMPRCTLTRGSLEEFNDRFHWFFVFASWTYRVPQLKNLRRARGAASVSTLLHLATHAFEAVLLFPFLQATLA